MNVPTRTTSLFLIGASIRAAAWSALRAGLAPRGVDLFADRDTAELCPVVRLPGRQYPRGLVRLAGAAADEPWMYTGALENWPRVIESILLRRPRLWGNPPEVLRRVRSPRLLFAWLHEHDLPCPRHCFQPPDPARGRWLIKPVASGGGQHIAFWDGRTSSRHRFFFQEFIEGQPCAAVYLGLNGRSRLLGVTEQLVGQDWLQAAPFHYCGSIGPLPLSPALRTGFERLGAVLAAGFKLQGLFGVDCVLRNGVPLPIEVNPRYTASIEVLERASDFASLAWQRAAFEPSSPAPAIETPIPAGQSVGKAILFSRQSLRFPSKVLWEGRNLEDFADIPQAGQQIDPGQPIMTFFSQALTIEGCRRKLQETADMLDRMLFGKYNQRGQWAVDSGR